MIQLQKKRSRNRGSIPIKDRIFFSFPLRPHPLGGPANGIFSGNRELFFSKIRDQGVKLIIKSLLKYKLLSALSLSVVAPKFSIVGMFVIAQL